MSMTCGILALLEAKPGKGDNLGAFLNAGRAIATAEPQTMSWYAFKLSDTTYGIFDTFADEDGRQAHLNGQIPVELGKIADELLAKEPDIRPIDIIAVK
ncbi:antibiotic biosynthesis monooxygenase [Mycobacterium sp. SM1]|nr:antibiotic biosynthesis monooxygenase [Mycobacterium sp. SM1]